MRTYVSVLNPLWVDNFLSKYVHTIIERYGKLIAI